MNKLFRFSPLLLLFSLAVFVKICMADSSRSKVDLKKRTRDCLRFTD